MVLFVTFRRGARLASPPLNASNASRSIGVGSYGSSSLAEACVGDCLLFSGDFKVLSLSSRQSLFKRVFWKSSGRFCGVKAVKTPVDMGFCVLGAALKFGIMSDVGIRQETASSVGRVFVRGLSGLRERSWRIR